MSTTTAQRRPPKHHTAEEVTRTLMEVAACDGSPYRAERVLKEQGIKVARRTIETWRDRDHAEEYAQIRRDLQGRIQEKLAERHEDLARQGADVTEKLWRRLDDEADDVPIRDLPGALRNAAVALAVSTDKTLTTRERPVVMPRPAPNIEQLAVKLERMGVLTRVPAHQPKAIDATAIEEPK